MCVASDIPEGYGNRGRRCRHASTRAPASSITTLASDQPQEGDGHKRAEMSDSRSVQQVVLDLQRRNRALAHKNGQPTAPLPARLPFVLLPIAVGAWLWSIHGVDLRQMNDLGLASVLGPAFVVALVVLSTSMAIALVRARPKEGQLLAHVLILIVVLYGTVPLLVAAPQGTAVYRHIGIANYVTAHGSVNRTIDAYFNWPGFFIMTSALTSITGARSALELARWGPLLFNFLFLAPVTLFFRAICRGTLYTWLCIWLFFCCNWVQQDIFSPQAYGYLGYLAILAVVVAFFRTNIRGDSSARNPPRAALLTLIALAFVAITMSHQLTPYALALGLGAFAAARGTRLWGLPIMMAIVSVAWFAYAATPFFARFLRQQGHSIGNVAENTNAGLGARLAGTPEHLFVVDSRVAFTLGLWGLGVVGVLIRRRLRLPIGAFAAIAVSTVALAGLQSYGGEIFLRTYLFALPAVVLFAAAPMALLRLRPLLRGTAVGALSIALLMLFIFARYGNARIDYFSPQEVLAMKKLYRIAPTGSLVMAGSGNLPWRFEGYNDYDYTAVDRLNAWVHGSTSQTSVDRVAAAIVKKMRSQNVRAYLVFTRSMEPWEEFVNRKRSGELARVQEAVVRLRAFRIVYRNKDASVYALKVKT